MLTKSVLQELLSIMREGISGYGNDTYLSIDCSDAIEDFIPSSSGREISSKIRSNVPARKASRNSIPLATSPGLKIALAVSLSATLIIGIYPQPFIVWAQQAIKPFSP